MATFLSLPPEVRLLIYRMVLPYKTYATLFIEDTLLGRSRSLPLGLNIILVNRLIQQETLPLLYTKVSFLLTSHVATGWLYQMGQSNRDALRDVSLYFQPYDHVGPIRKTLKLLSQCSSIHLVLLASLGTLATLDGWMRGVFRHMHGFQDVVIECGDHLLDAEAYLVASQSPEILGVWSGVRQRLENGRQRLMSSCPDNCKIHAGRSGDKSTARLTIRYNLALGAERICVVCACKAFYGAGPAGGHSIFKLKGDGDRSKRQAIDILLRANYTDHYHGPYPGP